jgi:MYXO-CTERM domain-containing protein
VKLFPICTTLAVFVAGFSSAQAASIPVSSYSYTGGTSAGQGGFTDPGGKLTDGLFGTVNDADGSWVGWQQASEQITFTFASSVTVTDVSIDFLRDVNANISVPGEVDIATTTFTPADFTGSPTKGFLDFAGSWTGSQLVITLDNRNGNQTFDFLNEVRFTSSGAGAAPEPGTIGMALAGLAAAIGWSRRRKYSTR